MNYLKSRLELIKNRKKEISKNNGVVLKNGANIIEFCNREMQSTAMNDKTKRLVNIILKYASSIIDASTSINIDILNLDDNINETEKIIEDMTKGEDR